MSESLGIERVRHEPGRRGLDWPEEVDSHVFIGDETAVPAITRDLGELPRGDRALVVIESAAQTEWPWFASRASLQVVWVRRKDPADPAQAIVESLRRLRFPAGQCSVWLAVESNAAPTIRRYLREERGLDADWIKAADYWQRDVTGSHDELAGD